jgi:hypothetical protein
MTHDPSERLHQIIEFRASGWYPGCVDLMTGMNPNNVAVTTFSLPDLAVLRAKIDELLDVPACPACADERHEDCPRHHNTDGSHPGYRCGCDQRRLHARILADQVALYRASRRG